MVSAHGQDYPRVCGGTRHGNLTELLGAARDYPRVCGGTAHFGHCPSMRPTIGLSPRVRGNHSRRNCSRLPRSLEGLSPRVRGNQQSPWLLQALTEMQAKDYPRVCGGTTAVGAMLELARPTMDYPRVCGGTNNRLAHEP